MYCFVFTARKDFYYGAILGGLVNSTATVAELSSWLSNQPELQHMALGVVVLAVLAARAISSFSLVHPCLYGVCSVLAWCSC